MQLAVREALDVTFSAEAERPSLFRDHSHRGVQRQRPRACIHLVRGLFGLLGRSRDHLASDSVRCFLLRVLLALLLRGRGFVLRLLEARCQRGPLACCGPSASYSEQREAWIAEPSLTRALFWRSAAFSFVFSRRAL